MKNKQQGFIIPLVIIVIALCAIGAGAYVYTKNKKTIDVSSNTQATSTTQTTTETASTSTNTKNSTWKIYSNTNLGISFEYPTSWGTPKELKDGSISFNEVFNVNSYPIANTPGIIPTSSMIVGGIKANVAASSQIGTLIQIPLKNNTTLEIEYGNSNTQDPILTHILSTIKFTSGIQASNSATNWKTYTGSNFTFQYPATVTGADLTIKAITTNTNQNIDASGCYAGITPNNQNNSQVTISGIKFCLSISGDVGAGQLYNYYYYTTLKGDTYITLAYSVHTSNGCGAYDQPSPAYTACVENAKNYDTLVVQPINQSVTTFKFTK